MTSTLLLIEDNGADAELAIRALKRLVNPLVWLKSPDEALDYLKKCGDNLDVLILLDLAFPGYSSGIDFLRHIRRISEWEKLPVIILTQDKTEAPRAYAHRAEYYLVKPINLAKLVTLVENFNNVQLIVGRV